MAIKQSVAQKIAAELKRADLSDDDRHLLITCIIDKFDALPLRDIISRANDGSLLIRGKGVDLEMAKTLRESARAVLNNYALTTVSDQVLFEAITNGFLRVDSEKQALFNRAAVWFGMRQKEHLDILAQTGVVIDEN